MFILDRIEENIAVLTEGTDIYEVDISFLPEGAKEGDSFEAETYDGMISALYPAVNPDKGKNKKRLSELFKKNGV